MATYNLNVTNNFCDHWGLWEAVREILQNGEDQLTINPENEIAVSYNPETLMLTVSNKDSILSRSSLLFGGTTKKDDENTIGKFGEGYKIALLIFKKLGIDVVIKNYAKNERWTTELLPDSKYDGVEVLKVKIKTYIFKTLPDHNLSFEIKGITPEQWEEIQSKYLKEQEVGEKFFDSKSKSEILLKPELKGKVFINGLFVESLKGKYQYGYNFHPSQLQLDRDRQSVHGYSFQEKLKTLLENYAESSSDAADTVLDLLKSDNNDISENTNFYMVGGKLFNATQNSLSSYGKYAYPVTSQLELDVVSEQCEAIRPVFVSKAEHSILQNDSKYSSIESFMSSHEELSKTKLVLSPRQELSAFYAVFKSSMYDYDMKKKFEELIKKSENWVDESEPLEDEEILSNDHVVLAEETLEEQFHNEELNLESTVPSSEEEKIQVVFDDDIPF